MAQLNGQNLIIHSNVNRQLCDLLNDYFEEVRECLLKPDQEVLQALQLVYNNLSNERNPTLVNLVIRAVTMAFVIKFNQFMTNAEKAEHKDELDSWLEDWADYLRGVAYHPEQYSYVHDARRFLVNHQESLDQHYGDRPWLKENLSTINRKLIQLLSE